MEPSINEWERHYHESVEAERLANEQPQSVATGLQATYEARNTRRVRRALLSISAIFNLVVYVGLVREGIVRKEIVEGDGVRGTLVLSERFG